MPSLTARSQTFKARASIRDIQAKTFATDNYASNVGNLRTTHRHEQEMESSGQQEH
jgi:hypothetical protein